MNRLLAIVLIALFPVLTNAQKWDFSYSMGVTKPLGSFSNNDITANDVGMAENGFFIQFSGNYSNIERLGLATALILSSNAMDDNANGLRLEKSVEKLFLKRSLTDDERRDLSYNSSDWRWGALLAGPMLKLPAGNSVFILKAMTGFQMNFIAKPEMIYDDEDNGLVFRGRVDDENKLSIPFLLGAELNYHLRSNISVRFGVDYYVSKMSYKNKYETIRRSNSEVTVLETEKRSVVPQNLNIGVGLIYHINI
ncbi:hypothetical protein EMN47_10620 [Prolixibacteraceae bacterium JC049]|nr:hypothetical protein [Prolixibacteraceae bacterium JC049]